MAYTQTELIEILNFDENEEGEIVLSNVVGGGRYTVQIERSEDGWDVFSEDATSGKTGDVSSYGADEQHMAYDHYLSLLDELADGNYLSTLDEVNQGISERW